MNIKIAFSAVLASILSACYPNQGNTIEDLDLVLTYHNETTDFKNYSTYIVADTVVYINESKDKKLNLELEQTLITKVDNQMMANGWVKESNPGSNPSDVAVLISVLEIENFSITTGWWDYWGSWGGWGYYPPYGAGGYYPQYPGYCCYASIYEYTTGTVLIEMIDPNNGANENDFDADPIPILWLGILDGLAEGSRVNIASRIEEGVDIMFEKSPYLKK